MDKIHTELEPANFTIPYTISLAEYDSYGKRIEGTSIVPDPDDERPYGMDYFSNVIQGEPYSIDSEDSDDYTSDDDEYGDYTPDDDYEGYEY